jgi:site-specific recombinase XerD
MHPQVQANKWVRKVARLNKYLSLTNDKGEPMQFRSHMLRDTFAVEMLLAGVPLEKVSKLLGHKLVATTQKTLRQVGRVTSAPVGG